MNDHHTLLLTEADGDPDKFPSKQGSTKPRDEKTACLFKLTSRALKMKSHPLVLALQHCEWDQASRKRTERAMSDLEMDQQGPGYWRHDACRS